MRIVILACALGLVVQSAAQTRATQPQVGLLLAALQSDKWSDRAEAYEHLRGDPAAMRDEAVKVALLDLQNRENHLPRATAPEPNNEEAYAEYKAQLLGTVESIVDWKNPDEVCILAHASYNTDSDFAAKLATGGKAIVPCLIQMAESSRPGDRFKSVAVLIHIRARKTDLDSGTDQRIRDIAIQALHDPDEGVRGFTVDALGKFGGEDMIPALQQVAETDPAPAIQGTSVRTIARMAIAEIQKRIK